MELVIMSERGKNLLTRKTKVIKVSGCVSIKLLCG